MLFMEGNVKITVNKETLSCFMEWYEDQLVFYSKEGNSFKIDIDTDLDVFKTFNGFEIYRQNGNLKFIVDLDELSQWHDTCNIYNEEDVLTDCEPKIDYDSIFKNYTLVSV